MGKPFEKLGTINNSRELSKDKGPEKVHKFLARTGFLKMLSNEEKFKQWFFKQEYSDFKDYLVRLNGLVRDIPIKERNIDGENVSIGNEMMGNEYLPPHQEDKDLLLQKAFEGAKKLPRKDAGLLLYYALQAVHPFSDGNGRTGRLLHTLLEKNDSGADVTSDELEELLIHDGDTGSGRESFANKIKQPEDVYEIINYLIATDEFGIDFTRKFKLVSSSLQGGQIESYNNENVSKDTKAKLDRLMSEGGGGRYAFRNTVLLKYLQSNDLTDEYVNEYEEKKILVLDGPKILRNLSEKNAEEIIGLDIDLKKKFVEKLFDVIINPEKYKVGEEDKTMKDWLHE